MNCPNCNTRTIVHNSRIGPDMTIRRGRTCPRCRLRLTTYERIEEQSFGPRKAGRKPAKSTTAQRSTMAD